jgi:hypothetical protein
MKKENAFLKRSLTEARPPQEPTWSGFRENPDASSDGSHEYEAPSTPTDEGNQTSDHSQHSPARSDEPPFDGFIHKLEKCQINSRSTSPVDRRAKERLQSSLVSTEPSMVSSVGSASSQHVMTESYVLNLRGNRMDFVLAADRQKLSAQSDSKTPVTAWADDL